MKLFSALLFFGILFTTASYAQTTDYVDVTFYFSPDISAGTVYLPGEFNGWTLNSNSLMTFDESSNSWSKTVRLRVGGPNPLPTSVSISGAYQYKIHVDGNWISDPLNPRQNPQAYNNSYLYLKNPTIHYLLPNSTPSSGIVRNRFPEISAYIFPSISSDIDPSTISVTIDNLEYTDLGSGYDINSKKFTFIPPVPLGDGEHQLILSAGSSTGSSNSDTTNFEIQSGVIQFLTLNAETWKSSWRLQGAIFADGGGLDSSITEVQINRFDSSWTVSSPNGRVDTTISLFEGDNYFSLSAQIEGQIEYSDSIKIIRKVNHNPYAQIDITQNGTSIVLSAAGSTDPDDQQLTYLWAEDPANPEVLGMGSSTNEENTIIKPATQGEYYFSLKAEDPDRNLDSTRAYFVVDENSLEVKIGGYKDNPEWLKNGRIYLLYFKSFTSEGTIRAAIPNLDYIKAMGFNIIWVLPVMEIPGSADNQINIGYYIIDLLNVESSLGTKEDYKEFVSEAHKRGIKIIQDVTPNHTGRDHPFAQEAIHNGDYSQYWHYYQTEFIPHNDNGLGNCVTPEGIWYYCAFSDVLLNYNWDDLDSRKYMIDVYNFWVNEFGIDGYRFDVYWGPSRKFGEAKMGIPVRENLKHIKPDIFLLGEDGGTGVGTEVVYADNGGGLDAAYDWSLYHDGIKNFNFTSSAVNTLHSKLDNNGYFPGENSYYLRFMENQDEDRITYNYDSFEKTMPVAAALFLAPGLPLMYGGQEVGFGKEMGAPGEPDLNDRRRGIIDWKFEGKDLLTPHYQKLAQIRGQFPAFSQHRMDTNGDGNVDNQDQSDFDKINTGNSLVYSYLRPYENSNGLAVVNFSNVSQDVTLNLAAAKMLFTEEFESAANYWVNDLYNGSSTQMTGNELAAFAVSLSAYGSAVYTISAEEEMVDLPPLPSVVTVEENKDIVSNAFTLFQNYPNPFNPTTVIQYQIPADVRTGDDLNVTNSNTGSTGQHLSLPGLHVKLIVYDILGREIKTLVNESQSPGQYQVEFDAAGLSSGIYFYRLQTGDFVKTNKMILLR